MNVMTPVVATATESEKLGRFAEARTEFERAATLRFAANADFGANAPQNHQNNRQ